jgi:hypothetical protein
MYRRSQAENVKGRDHLEGPDVRMISECILRKLGVHDVAWIIWLRRRSVGGLL